MADVTLMLEKFDFIADGDKDGTVLTIQGHSGGLIGQLLHALHINEDSFLIVSKREVTFQFAGLGGITYIVCPLDTITCSVCGITKPLWQLIIGILAVLSGISLFGSSSSTVGIIALVVGAALLFSYVRTTYLIVTFSTGDMGDTHGLAFGARTKGGTTLRIENLLEAIEYINHYLLATRKPKRDQA